MALKKADELLVGVALHARADHRPLEHVSAANSVVVPWRL
jgi:hypothetical protein